jgi:hypothetical protein
MIEGFGILQYYWGPARPGPQGPRAAASSASATAPAAPRVERNLVSHRFGPLYRTISDLYIAPFRTFVQGTRKNTGR